MAENENNDKLIFLLPEDVSKQMDRIFEELNENEELRVRFTNDPVGVMKELGVDIPFNIDISLANRIIFYLSGNKAYIAWLHNYIEELRSSFDDNIPLDRETGEAIAKEIERAMKEHLSSELRNEYEQAGGMAAFSIVALAVAFLGIAVALSVHIVLAINFATGVNVYFQENLWSDTHFSASGGGISGGKAWGGPDG